MIEPLEISFTVACTVNHAFETWTRRINLWWPPDHTVSGERDATVVLEPEVGGRIYERTRSGDEFEWGEITIWEPPYRFGYLWHLHRDRSEATDVEITFSQIDEGSSRVVIVHTAWERLGAGGQDWRDRNFGGWSSLLPHFITEAERKLS